LRKLVHADGPESPPSGRGGYAILSRLKSIARRFWSSEEFVIDARPLETIAARRSSNGSSRPATNGASTFAPPVESHEEAPESPAPAVQDLYSSLHRIMAEHGRLAEKIAAEVKPVGAHDDEFKRFAHQIMPYLDAMERTFDLSRKNEPSEEAKGWLESFETAHARRLLPVLEKFGFEVMNCMGQTVDFNIHDVIEYRRTKDHLHNTVIEEISKGIKFRGRILRDAKVIVACNER
jgi:molecular chaperone GrpE